MKFLKNPVTLLITIASFESLAANLAHPITPTLMTELQMPDYMFGLAFASMALTNFLFSPFWGKISEYFHVRKLLAICCFGYSAGQLLFGFATTQTTIVIARLLAGIFAGGISVLTLIYLINISTTEERSANITIFATLITAFSSIGYFVGGMIGDYSLIATFIVQVVMLIGSGLLFYFLLDNSTLQATLHSVKEVVRQANPFQSFMNMKEIMTNVFFALLVICFISSFASIAYDKNFDYFIKQQLDFKPSYNGIIKAIVGIISLVSNLTICMWIIRTGKVKKYFAMIMAACAILLAGVVLIDDLIPFLMINIVFFAVNSIYIPLLQNIVSNAVQPEKTGIAMGSYNSLRALGMIVGSLAAGYVYAFGPKLAFIMAALLFILATLLAIYVYRQAAEPSDLCLDTQHN